MSKYQIGDYVVINGSATFQMYNGRLAQVVGIVDMDAGAYRVKVLGAYGDFVTNERLFSPPDMKTICDSLFQLAKQMEMERKLNQS